MRLLLLVIATLCFQAQAFKDTSPFLLFSSSSLPDSIRLSPQEQIKSRAHVLRTTELFLSECPSETYLILLQPSISASQLSSETSPIRQFSKSSHIKTRISFKDAVGLKVEDGIRTLRYLKSKCGSKSLVEWPLNSSLGRKESGNSLAILKKLEEDEIISDNSPVNDILKNITQQSNFTLIIITTPNFVTKNVLATDNSESMLPHAELRRGLEARGHVISNNADLRPLFEKYQFLNPGLFAGILVSVILLAILSVGIRAISSLEVSYGAFDKEMGPEKQKKQ